MSDYKVGYKELEESLMVSSEAMGFDGSPEPPATAVENVVEMLEQEGIDPDELKEYSKTEVGVVLDHPLFQQLFKTYPAELAAAIWLMGFNRAWFVLKKINDPLEEAITDA